jgi:hypothetical protein
MAYIAIIGDIVESRTIGNRAEFQRDVATLFAEISKANRRIVSPYTITLGDEFQALYKSAESLFSDLIEVIRHLYPVKLRIAVGIGSITTVINRQQAIGMDGPAFHLAREVMDRIKAEDRTLIQLTTEPKSDTIAEELANTGLALLADLSRTWKANSWSILSELLQGRSISSIAGSLSISQRAVYKNIRTNGIQTTLDLCNGIARLMSAETSRKTRAGSR